MSQLKQSELVTLFEARYRVRQIAYGTLSLLIFDVLLTLKAEVAYIWKRPWSLFKTLYLICRYVPLVTTCILAAPETSSDYCFVVVWYLLSGTTMLCIFPSDCLLAIRLDKLYTSKRVRRTLIATLICEAIAQITLVILNAADAKVSVIGAPGIKSPLESCFWTNFVSTSFLRLSPGIPSLFIGVTYSWFALAAFHRHLSLKQTLNTHRLLRESGTFAPMLTVLFRNGVIYYLTNFISAIAALTLFGVYGQTVLVGVAPLFVAATSSIVSSRFVLILKGDPNYATGVYHSGNELRIVSQEARDLTALNFDEEY